MSEFGAVLAAFREATGREVAFWERSDSNGAPQLLAATSPEFRARTSQGAKAEDVASWAREQELTVHHVATIEGTGWLFSEQDSQPDAERFLARLLPVVHRIVRERDGATRELAERYEEISLLYTIGELLGSSTSVDAVAGTLLREMAITVGAPRAAFLILNEQTGYLEPVATLGIVGRRYGAVSITDTVHIGARAFRLAQTVVDDSAAASSTEPVLATGGGGVLAAAVTRANTGDESSAGPLGVVILGGRSDHTPFNAGDRKLVMAVANQVGTALHNTRLVRAAVEREQFARELRLAHDLQLKLLPDPRVVGPEARAAARVVPAESVGGDFYLLSRLDARRTGVMIGDVSGHGYQAALVMALALSAAAIHVQAAADPAATLEAVRRSIAEELRSTEMSLSLCYVIIDSVAHELRFANAGHPHAFRLGLDGNAVRMTAMSPPLGLGDAPVRGGALQFRQGDRVLMFTDGLIDARNPQDHRLGEAAVLKHAAQVPRAAGPEKLVARLFDCVDQHAQGVPPRDDLAALVVDRF
ncbi:MAG: SpoIIE family protein phosphatase [Phycisphaerae bacterium]|nr:SpoIIE family protein phosphatase [Gemmatimonadaceae bacterium]